MKAMVVADPGGPDALHLVETDDPPAAPGSVVVDVVAAGINPVDAGNRGDPSWAGIAAPFIVGYEFSGVVAEAAEGFEAGEAVWGALPVRGTRRGAYAEKVAVPAGLLARRPPAIDELSAACIPLAGLTAKQILDRLALPAGSWLLVHGVAGGVGQFLAQLARGRGLSVAATGRPSQRALVEELGVSLWANRDDANPIEALRDSLGHPFDGVVDLVGGRIEPSLPHVAEGGAAASIVDLSGDFELAIDSNITVHGILVRPGADALDALARELGDSIRPRIRRVYPLEAAADAHRELEGGGVDGKLVLRVR
jgi:NADPH:quinone reductase-like Zn-dependent oxidoreductase